MYFLRLQLQFNMLVPENSEEIDLDPFPFSSSPRPSSIVLHRMQQQSSRKSNLAQTEGHLKERSQVLSFSSNTADISFCGDGDGLPEKTGYCGDYGVQQHGKEGHSISLADNMDSPINSVDVNRCANKVPKAHVDHNQFPYQENLLCSNPINVREDEMFNSQNCATFTVANAWSGTCAFNRKTAASQGHIFTTAQKEQEELEVCGQMKRPVTNDTDSSDYGVPTEDCDVQEDDLSDKTMWDTPTTITVALFIALRFLYECYFGHWDLFIGLYENEAGQWNISH